ncbi:MAG: hypothetical protein AAFZ01_02125 [Pseudomonadota bacterium]
MGPAEAVHATCVVIDGAGVLIRGPSGAGKSDLALRALDACASAALVADDLVLLSRSDDTVRACAPEAIFGRMEVRGLGIVTLPEAQLVASSRIALIVDACRPDKMTRLPTSAALRADLLGCSIARITFDLHAASAVARIQIALRHFGTT